MSEKLLTADEAAAKAGVIGTTLRNAIRAGKLKATVITGVPAQGGRSYRIKPSDFEEWRKKYANKN